MSYKNYNSKLNTFGSTWMCCSDKGRIYLGEKFSFNNGDPPRVWVRTSSEVTL